MSQLYGGRITDAQLTILCGIIDLIESGDEILADKGFPEVRIFAFFSCCKHFFVVKNVFCLKQFYSLACKYSSQDKYICFDPLEPSLSILFL